MEKLTGLKNIKTAIFISGMGSNLENLIKFSKLKKSPISIDLIVSNTRLAKGLQFADQYKIKKETFNFKNFVKAEKNILILLKKKK
jgi:phosphoribosylglycinamide formyltransferase-1